MALNTCLSPPPPFGCLEDIFGYLSSDVLPRVYDVGDRILQGCEAADVPRDR